MGNKLNWAMLFAIIILSLSTYYQGYKLTQKDNKISTLTQNVKTLTEDAKLSIVRDSLIASEKGTLVMELEELQELRAKDAQLIADLNLRLRDVRTVTHTATVYRDTVILAVRDTAAPVLSYRDNWTDITYIPEDSTLTYTFRDSVTNVLHVAYQKRFLWWRWKPRYKVTTVSHNPRCTHIATETVIRED